MHLKPYPVEFMTVMVLDYDCMQFRLKHYRNLQNFGSVMHTISDRYDQSFLDFHCSSI